MNGVKISDGTLCNSTVDNSVIQNSQLINVTGTVTDSNHNGLGLESTVVGLSATSGGDRSVGFGWDSVSTGNDSVAIGHTGTATGTGTIAIGAAASATTAGTIAIGPLADVSGAQSIVLSPDDVDLSGLRSVYIGSSGVGVIGAGNDTIVVGSAPAIGARTVIAGNVTASASDDCVTIGHAATSTVANTVVVGRTASGTGIGGVAIGHSASAETGIAIGPSTVSNGLGVHVGVNIGNTSLWQNSAVFGRSINTVLGSLAGSSVVAIGISLQIDSSADNHTVVGFNTSVYSTTGSVVCVGDDNQVNSGGGGSAVFGSFNEVGSLGSVVLGTSNQVTDAALSTIVCIGDNNIVAIERGIVIGRDNEIEGTPPKENSIAIGWSLINNDDASHSYLIGDSIEATVNDTFSVGNGTIWQGFGARVNATQPTNVNTNVTCNGLHGRIQLAGAIGAGGTATFTVNNNRCHANSEVWIMMVANSNTSFTYHVKAIATGSFDVRILSTTATGTPVYMHYMIMGQHQ